MGRRRDWQETDVSRAWRTILMGQRPPVQWPRSWEKRGRSSSAVHSKIPVAGHRQTVPSLRTINFEAVQTTVSWRHKHV